MANFIQKKKLNRRTVLRGLGAVIALPYLEAMTPAFAGSTPKTPVRCGFVYAPNGKKMDDWTPKTTGSRFKLPFILEPLEKHREFVQVFTGLALDGARAHGDGAGDHARSAGAFLTAAHPVKKGVSVGISVDQVLAQAFGQATPFPSLELGCERGRRSGNCDSGYNCAYTTNISWRSATTPVPKETQPRAVFERLFGDPNKALDLAAKEERRKKRKSILDQALADTKSLRGKLGSADRSKLDEYLSSVRDLEKRLSRTDKGGGGQVQLPDGLYTEGEVDGYQARVRHMYELMALAFQTDQTRVSSFMLGNAGSNRSYPFLGVAEGHHVTSHHGMKKEKLAAIRKINRFQMEEFARFLGHLNSIKEGDGTLLTNSVILYGSGISDGNRHSHHDLPILLAGRGGGMLKKGRHVKMKKETPLANLYLDLLIKMGVKTDSFGDSKGRVSI
ncbi:MAG: hypothetical protein ACI97A_002847 [Planctomycetota bacterium]|jgi:hypothetical protein